MSMEIVNGYVCRNCSDVSLAKRNIDPARPHDPPGEPARPADRGPAVTFSGVLQGLQASGPAPPDRPAPLRPGATLNLSV